MPGMRYRESGRDCPCCSQWAPTRVSEKRNWRRIERQQVAPWEFWVGDVRNISGPHWLEPDWLVHDYWGAIQEDDSFLNEHTRHLQGLPSA